MVCRFVVLLSCIAVAPVTAQDQSAAQDSLPFRRGQWAAHFNLGGFGGVGVSRFRSPSRALLFLVNVSAAHGEYVVEDPLTGRRVGVQSEAGATARLGWRRYRVGSTRITPYRSVGPVFSFSHLYSSNVNGTSSSNGWSLGLFGDIGALYHVTGSLALGAAASGDVRYARSVSRTRTSTDYRASTWEIRFAGVTIGAGLTLLF